MKNEQSSKKISAIAIELADFEFSQEQAKNKWLGINPQTDMPCSAHLFYKFKTAGS